MDMVTYSRQLIKELDPKLGFHWYCGNFSIEFSGLWTINGLLHQAPDDVFQICQYNSARLHHD